ncbi:MAG: GntR family transcriptional regulator [Acidobacteriota bacterium]
MKRSRPRSTDSRSQLVRAYEGIRSHIVDGTYRGGDPLTEELLARSHGTSRTPVREALAQLAQDGYVERVPGRGYFVARVTVQLVRDTFEVRRLLEGNTAARAAELATGPERERLAALADYRFSPNDRAGYRRAEIANARFHMAIAAASRNQLAERLVLQCLAQMDRFISLGIDVAPLPEEATRDHRAILRAIDQRDPTAARVAMQAHLDRSSSVLVQALLRGTLTGVMP